MLQVTLPGYCFLHDLGITSSYYVIFQNPVSLRMLPLLLGTLCPAHCIGWTGNPPKIHLFSRPAPSPEPAAIPHAEEKKQGFHPSVQLVATSDLTSRGKSRGQAMQACIASQKGGERPKANQDGMAPSGASSGGKRVEGGGRCSDQKILAADSQAVTVASIPEGFVQAFQSTTGEASTCGQPPIPSQEAAFVFHQANSYESEDGRSVIVDCIRYPSMPDFEQVWYSWLLDRHAALA